ncbi:MAG TPA: prepilin-type N-terminal cleavage/methylation domain-containing protein [Kofleriaceae bacterium]|nr:prepilin-type N-terminal cleavage/methylation domain-containing protein [Kofleriaceae bacterium]
MRVGRRRRRDAGFTMVEVMVAILLTAIAVIGILALYMTQTRASSYSRHSSEAAVLAADGLEKLRTMNPPTGGTETGLTETGKTGGMFTRVSEVVGTSTPYDVKVTVSWEESGAMRSVIVWGKM